MPVQQVAVRQDHRGALAVVLVVDPDGGGVLLAHRYVGHDAAAGRRGGKCSIPVSCAAGRAGGIGNLTALRLLGTQSRLPIVGPGRGEEICGLASGSDLIGRDGELSRLRRLVDPPLAESRVLILLGDPGMGKTVLLAEAADRKSTRLNSSHVKISYAVFCLKKK